jgi:hypothetical protein
MPKFRLVAEFVSEKPISLIRKDMRSILPPVEKLHVTKIKTPQRRVLTPANKEVLGGHSA